MREEWRERESNEEEPQFCDDRLNDYLHQTHSLCHKRILFHLLAARQERKLLRNKSKRITLFMFSLLISFGLMGRRDFNMIQVCLFDLRTSCRAFSLTNRFVFCFRFFIC